METLAATAGNACFLCDANHPWVYDQSEHFVALLGLGPIAEGYSIIAARDHVPSMFDLEPEVAEELAAFTSCVRDRLRPHYGDAVITEHGRIAPCLAAYARAYEPHCLHAHRLVFPGQPRIELTGFFPRAEIQRWDSFLEAFRAFEWEGQYLYAEHADGMCEVVPVGRRMPRQFFRRLAALRMGHPELADWSAHPRLEIVAAGQRRLG
jgi:hypothetical protein